MEPSLATQGLEPGVRLGLYRQMLRIRRTEETLLELFEQGKLFGTTHTSIGQEAIAVAVMEALDLERDVVFSAHRCHGHFLAYGGDLVALFAEIMGRSTGVCGGIGGSQHLHFKNFATSGIQGSIVPQAGGSALAEVRLGSGAISVVFLGDGTLGEGIVYETLNMASLWSSPTLFVLEDNGYAQSTPKRLGVAGSMVARARAFGIEAESLESNDVEELLPLVRSRVGLVRSSGRPFFQIVRTFRLAAHSKGDDDRDPKEIAAWRERDPVEMLARRLPERDRVEIQTAVDSEVEAAVQEADAAPWPEPESLSIPLLSVHRDAFEATSLGEISREGLSPPPLTGRDLNRALHEMMEADDRVIVIGEDIIDPYGGAFKVTQGLSDRFGDRVMTTPISEAAIVGIANGMALRGLRPVVEIMFGDFVLLAADQILNHAAKLRAMYGDDVTCPITVRTPMGGRRGYGPTHSQSLEKLFLGAPGLEVVAPCEVHPVGELLRRAVIESEDPTLFIENKSMYARPLKAADEAGYIGEFQLRVDGGMYPTARLSLDDFNVPEVILLTYGGSVDLCMQAALRLLIDHEVSCELVVPSLLCPLPVDDLVPPVAAAGRVLVVEEGTTEWGWGAEVAAALHERLGRDLPGGCVARLGARDFVLPASRPLEEAVLPQVADVISATLSLCRGRT